MSEGLNPTEHDCGNCASADICPGPNFHAEYDPNKFKASSTINSPNVRRDLTSMIIENSAGISTEHTPPSDTEPSENSFLEPHESPNLETEDNSVAAETIGDHSILETEKQDSKIENQKEYQKLDFKKDNRTTEIKYVDWQPNPETETPKEVLNEAVLAATASIDTQKFKIFDRTTGDENSTSRLIQREDGTYDAVFDDNGIQDTWRHRSESWTEGSTQGHEKPEDPSLQNVFQEVAEKGIGVLETNDVIIIFVRDGNIIRPVQTFERIKEKQKEDEGLPATPEKPPIRDITSRVESIPHAPTPPKPDQPPAPPTPDGILGVNASGETIATPKTFAQKNYDSARNQGISIAPEITAKVFDAEDNNTLKTFVAEFVTKMKGPASTDAVEHEISSDHTPQPKEAANKTPIIDEALVVNKAPVVKPVENILHTSPSTETDSAQRQSTFESRAQGITNRVEEVDSQAYQEAGAPVEDDIQTFEQSSDSQKNTASSNESNANHFNSAELVTDQIMTVENTITTHAVERVAALEAEIVNANTDQVEPIHIEIPEEHNHAGPEIESDIDQLSEAYSEAITAEIKKSQIEAVTPKPEAITVIEEIQELRHRLETIRSVNASKAGSELQIRVNHLKKEIQQAEDVLAILRTSITNNGRALKTPKLKEPIRRSFNTPIPAATSSTQSPTEYEEELLTLAA